MRHFLSTKAIHILTSLFLGIGLSINPRPACARTDFQPGIQTPLETSGFQVLTTTAGRSDYLRRIAALNPPADVSTELRVIGYSVRQNPIEAIVIGPKNHGATKPARVLLIGSQHGSEPSGCEALLVLARDLMFDKDLRLLLNKMTFMIIPAMNPDGIAANKRVNAQGVNLSTDFGRLEAPESSAVQKILTDFKPDIVLDVHESALLKKKSLGAEGFLTDFECQFDVANNPNVFEPIRKFSADVLLPDLLKRVVAEGLPAGRYIGEITRTGQIITHGGLSAHNLRNKAGLHGAFSFVLENRLDPSTGAYPTPRNIKERVRKQLVSIRNFLQTCVPHVGKICETTNAARSRMRPFTPIWLNPSYVANPSYPTIDIPLRRIDTGKLENHTFVYHKNIEAGVPFTPPPAYRIETRIAFFREWFVKQGIDFQPCASEGQDACIRAMVNPPNGHLLPLYLEVESSSCILNRLPFPIESIRIQRDSSTPAAK